MQRTRIVPGCVGIIVCGKGFAIDEALQGRRYNFVADQSIVMRQQATNLCRRCAGRNGTPLGLDVVFLQLEGGPGLFSYVLHQFVAVVEPGTHFSFFEMGGQFVIVGLRLLPGIRGDIGVRIVNMAQDQPSRVNRFQQVAGNPRQENGVRLNTSVRRNTNRNPQRNQAGGQTMACRPVLGFQGPDPRAIPITFASHVVHFDLAIGISSGPELVGLFPVQLPSEPGVVIGQDAVLNQAVLRRHTIRIR